MINEAVLLESKTLRDSVLDRTDVLDSNPARLRRAPGAQ
jgi:hypothetical protein